MQEQAKQKPESREGTQVSASLENPLLGIHASIALPEITQVIDTGTKKVSGHISVPKPMDTASLLLKNRISSTIQDSVPEEMSFDNSD